MNLKYQKFQANKRYFNFNFIIPPEKYLENLKNLYRKFEDFKPKSLKDLKRLALIEAKKTSQALMKISKESRLEIILSREAVMKILQSTFDSVNGLFIKINHNFKNERRRVYEDNEKYMEIIKKFETNKLKLFRYTIKNICKSSKISFESLQKSIFMYLKKQDNQVIDLVNKSSNLGKHYAIAPHSIIASEVLEILRKYYSNLKFILSNSPDSDVSKYALVIVNDIIYENYGLEEEQIFNLITERKEFKENKEIIQYLNLIKDLVTENLNTLFEL